MQKAIISLPLTNKDKSQTILVETSVSQGASGFAEASGAGTVIRAKNTMEEAISQIGPLMQSLMDNIKEHAHSPKKIALELGVKFGAKGNIIISSGEAEANCKITMEWESDG